MDILDYNPNQVVDLFGDPKASTSPDKSNTPNFGGGGTNPDLFASVINTTTAAPLISTTDTTTLPASSTVETTTIPANVDILGTTPAPADDDKGKPGRKPKYDFTEMTGYFESRIKDGKFVAIEETLNDGSTRQFIPKTPEEFDEVIELQVDHRYQQATRDLDKRWYSSKTPAWQTVAQYAEMVEDPKQLIPFIQGVQKIDSVAEYNENEVDGAEKIVRVRMSQRGDPEEVINEQIESLKSSDKLVSTAQKVKPLILKQEQDNLKNMVAEQKRQEAEYDQLVYNIREGAIKAIEQPLYGKKLKNDEKAAIYDLIAEPSQQSQGYGIYTIIDHLFETGNFETLKEIALLIAKKDSYHGYISNEAATKTAQSLERKLRVSTEARTQGTSTDGKEEPEPIVVKRQPYQSQGGARFGR